MGKSVVIFFIGKSYFIKGFYINVQEVRQLFEDENKADCGEYVFNDGRREIEFDDFCFD